MQNGSEEQKAHALIREGYEANFNGEAYSSVMLPKREPFSPCYRRIHGSRSPKEVISGPRLVGLAKPLDGEPPTFEATTLAGSHDRRVRLATVVTQVFSTIRRSIKLAYLSKQLVESTQATLAPSTCSWTTPLAISGFSINLMKFRLEPTVLFDVEWVRSPLAASSSSLRKSSIDHASYPTDRIAHNSHLFRPLGLGYSLTSVQLDHDSTACRLRFRCKLAVLCGSLTALAPRYSQPNQRRNGGSGRAVR